MSACPIPLSFWIVYLHAELSRLWSDEVESLRTRHRRAILWLLKVTIGRTVHEGSYPSRPAKRVFQFHGVDRNGNVVVRRKLHRAEVISFFDRLPTCLVGTGACAKVPIDRVLRTQTLLITQ